MNDLIEDWLRFKSHNEGRTEGTVGKYRGYLRRLETFLLSRHATLVTADQTLLESFTGLDAHKAGLSPRSRRALVAAVKGFYAWMQRADIRTDNPAERVPYPVAGRPLPTPLENKHAQALLQQPDLDTFEGLRDCAILMTLIGCGLRISGLIGLNESALQLVDVNGIDWLIIKVMEKGKRERLIPAPHDVKYIVHAYLGHPELTRIDRTLPDGDRVLFVSMMNRLVPASEYHGEQRRISARSVHDMIRKYGKRASIPANQLHPHAMRHLYGTELAEHEIDVITRQALLGHADPKTTEIYTHLAMRKLTKVVDAANPFRSIRTPLSDLVMELERRKG